MKIREEDIPGDLGIHRKNFVQPCFASRQPEECSEVDRHNVAQLARASNKDELKEILLIISFFDIWTANEDRSHNNYNLLFKAIDGAYKINVIDHGACFNHGELKENLIPLAFEESLIYSELYELLFRPKQLIKNFDLNALKKRYYVYAGSCKEQLAIILSAVPAEWNINIADQSKKLEDYFFTDEWFEDAWMTFLEFLQ